MRCSDKHFKGIFVRINDFIRLILNISNPKSNSHFVSTPHALFLKGDAKNTNIIFSGDSQHLLGGCYTHTPTVTTPYSMNTILEYSEAQLNSIFIQTNDPLKPVLAGRRMSALMKDQTETGVFSTKFFIRMTL